MMERKKILTPLNEIALNIEAMGLTSATEASNTCAIDYKVGDERIEQ
jgi:hypothetical protein